MKLHSRSEKLFLEEVREVGKKMKVAMKGLSIGIFIQMIRNNLGISQRVLALRAKVPQSTISRIEQNKTDVTLSTLNKILKALSCDLILAPLMSDSIETLRRKQAKKIAEKRVQYLAGTMNLEGQKPDSKFVQELIEQEEDSLLYGPNSKLWEE